MALRQDSGSVNFFILLTLSHCSKNLPEKVLVFSVTPFKIDQNKIKTVQ